jgi:hypothetical protein
MSTLLLRVHAALTAADIPAALIGAAAMAVHGVSRSTVDQDLLVVETRALDETTWTEVRPAAHLDVRRGGPDDPLAGVVRISAAGQRDVDVVVGRYAWQRELIEEALPVAVDGGVIPVVPLSALVLLKLYAGGPQDLWDIEQLRAIGGSSVDEAVDARVRHLPRSAQEAWQQLKAGP